MDVAEACAENGIKLYKMTSLGSFIVCLTIGRVCGRVVKLDLRIWDQASPLALFPHTRKELYSTLSVFTQLYKWVPATYCWRVTLRWISIPYRGE